MALPIINLSLVPNFPARVVQSGPIVITKAGLTYTFGWDITKFTSNPAPDATQVQVLGYNGATGATERYPLPAIQTGLQITASQVTDSTASGRSVLTGDAPTGRTALGLGPIAVLNIGAGLSASAGALLLATSGATAGSYTNPNVSIDTYGRITSVSSGSAAGGALGQCRLVKSGANIVLQPFNGNALTINGVNQTIPSAGVSLAPTGLTVSTLYYVYAYMSGATMTLEASATARATDTGTGVQIKTGDATRTLVGLVRPITGPAFADTAAQRFVISWFNRINIAVYAQLTSDVTFTAAPFSEVSTTIRNEFVTWSNEAVQPIVGGAWTVTGAAIGVARLSFDGTTGGFARCQVTATTSSAIVLAEPATLLSEGYHYVTIEGGRTGGTNVLFQGTLNSNISLTTTISG